MIVSSMMCSPTTTLKTRMMTTVYASEPDSLSLMSFNQSTRWDENGYDLFWFDGLLSFVSHYWLLANALCCPSSSDEEDLASDYLIS